MKLKISLLCIALFALLVLSAAPVFAVKPAANLGAQTVAWNLSSEVMPVPPYGSRDIIGSDADSKLIVNQPNGAVETTITGVMNGLNPNTVYTVYLSKAYTPYVATGWNVAGNYVIDLTVGTTHYTEYLVLSQQGSDITGVSLALAGGASTWTITAGSVSGNTVEIYAYFKTNPSMTITMTGIIAADGTISGTWADDAPGTRSGTWSTTSGHAVMTHTGNTGWPGLFTGTVQPFTFTTDEYGSGSWHINLRNSDFASSGTYGMSVWINDGATILISDTFSVVVE